MFKVRIDYTSPEIEQASQWALSGMGLQLLGGILDLPRHGMISPLGLTFTVVGALCLMFAVFKLAKAKNRSPMWAILGLFSLVGWCLVAFLEDHSPDRLPEQLA